MRSIDFNDGFESGTSSTEGAIPASDISVTPSGNLASTNVQSALEEHQTDIDSINSRTSNIDNTSDINKPVSTAQAAADATVLSTAESYTDSKITALIGGAPVSLDTLSELAAALASDPNFAATIATALGNRVRVDTNAQGLNSTQKTNAKTNIGLENVDNTSDATKNAATATLSNKTLTAPIIDLLNATEQGSTPSTPSAGQRKFYSKSDGLYQLTSAGVESKVGSDITQTGKTDTFSGNGSTTIFTLTDPPGDINNIQVYVHGIYQNKATYSLSGTTLTFSEAPPSGTQNIEVKYGVAVNGVTLPLSSPPLLVTYGTGSGNYVPSANTKYIFFRMWGPGGGGCGSARGTSNDAGDGGAGSGATTFGTSSAGAGGGGAKGIGKPGSGGAGGAVTLGSGVAGIAIPGNFGGGGSQGNYGAGADGGYSPYLGGAGRGGNGGSAAQAATAYGAGGGGGGGTAEASASFTGPGGGSGGYVEGYINNPSTISYSIGTGGSPGSGGTGPGWAGSSGANGYLMIWEFK